MAELENMAKDATLIIVADYAKTPRLTLDELCEICQISPGVIKELVNYAIVHPQAEEQWYFDLEQLRRIKTALRLQHDLELNLAGVALVLDLLNEVQELRAKAEWLESHFAKRE